MDTSSRQKLHARAVEIAETDGRTASSVTKADWDQARLELGSPQENDSLPPSVESIPESERWDPVPGTSGSAAPVTPSSDEDAEGRSIQERLLDEGMASAERDLALQAARKAAERE